MIKNYIFTVTNGRSGQATLHKYLKLYSLECLSAFEEPNIALILPTIFSNIEKKIRRKYFETHELLGRGKVLKAYQEKNLNYLKKIAKLRIAKIEKDSQNTSISNYFDVSKFYVRGLYEGFNLILENYKLVYLVRDPLLNMKSYINRGKNFFLDNSSPSSSNNLLIIKDSLIKEELYLWSWCETFLRYNKMSKNRKVYKTLIIQTSDLDKADKVKKAFDYLEIKYKPFTKLEKVNTNKQAGNSSTEVNKKDIQILKGFIMKLSKGNKSLINSINLSIDKHERNTK